MINKLDSTDIENKIEERFSDFETEEKLIAYIIKKDYKIIYEIKEEYFLNTSYQFFYEIIKKNSTGFTKKIFIKEIEEKSNKNDKDKNLRYANRIFQIEIRELNKNNINSLIEEIKEKYEARKTISAVRDVIDSIDDFDIGKVRKILRPIYDLVTESGDNKKEILEDFEEVYDKIKDRKKDKNILIPTGIKKIDKVMGGLMKGEVGLIAAETGLGKSILLSNIALNAWNMGYNVVFYSLEMDDMSVRLRMYSNIARILYSKFRMSGLDENDYKSWKDCVDIHRKEKSNFLYIITKPRGVNGFEIENDLYKIQEEKEKKVNLLLVDYLNIMSPNNKVKNVSGKDSGVQGDISWNLRQLAGGFNNNDGLPLWTAGQLIDSAYGKIPKKTDIKYSRGISENLAVMLGLSETEDNIFVNTMTVNFIKTRDSKSVAPFEICPQFDYMKFVDIEKEVKNFNEKTGEVYE